MRKITLLLGLLFALILYNCENDNDSKGLITVSGITELDNSANNIGNSLTNGL